MNDNFISTLYYGWMDGELLNEWNAISFESGEIKVLWCMENPKIRSIEASN